MPNQFSDFWNFLIGNTEDYNALGSWKYVFVVLFVALIALSAAIAVENWQNDPTQRTGAHLATCVIRVMVGGMWFQGMLWKLRLPVSDGPEVSGRPSPGRPPTQSTLLNSLLVLKTSPRKRPASIVGCNPH